MSNLIKTIFFSEPVQRLYKALVIALIAIAVFSWIAAYFFSAIYILAVDLLALMMVVLVNYPRIGLYLTVFFYPFVNWQFVWGRLNVPYVDLMALLTFGAVLINAATRIFLGQKSQRKVLINDLLPGALFAGLFFVASALSVFSNEFWQPAVKYLLRPIIFFYLMFVVLPVNLIKNKKTFKIVLYIVFVVGLLIASNGLLSVLFGAGPWYTHRAVPFQISDFNPIGGNHNALAEILVIALPAALILFSQSKKIKQKGWYVLAMLFMAGILLLTFSRSGWLVLLLQLLILFFARYRHKIDKYTIVAIMLVLVLAPVLLYFTVWHDIGWIQSSNANRLEMTKIAFYQFLQHPVIGNGLNTFQQLMGRTFAYYIEFGDPLDSHGFAQKVATESGLLGLITFIGFIGYIGREYFLAYQRQKHLTDKSIILCLILMFAGIVFFELFSTSYYIAKMWLPIGVGLSGVRLYRG